MCNGNNNNNAPIFFPFSRGKCRFVLIACGSGGCFWWIRLFSRRRRILRKLRRGGGKMYFFGSSRAEVGGKGEWAENWKITSSSLTFPHMHVILCSFFPQLTRWDFFKGKTRVCREKILLLFSRGICMHFSCSFFFLAKVIGNNHYYYRDRRYSAGVFIFFYVNYCGETK